MSRPDPWLNVYPPKLIEYLRRFNLDEETFGRLLNHIVNCPRCQKRAQRRFK